jgi:hypothetical protein
MSLIQQPVSELGLKYPAHREICSHGAKRCPLTLCPVHSLFKETAESGPISQSSSTLE